MATQRPAKPCTPVRIRSWPPASHRRALRLFIAPRLLPLTPPRKALRLRRRRNRRQRGEHRNCDPAHIGSGCLWTPAGLGDQRPTCPGRIFRASLQQRRKPRLQPHRRHPRGRHPRRQRPRSLRTRRRLHVRPPGVQGRIPSRGDSGVGVQGIVIPPVPGMQVPHPAGFARGPGQFAVRGRAKSC